MTLRHAMWISGFMAAVLPTGSALAAPEKADSPPDLALLKKVNVSTDTKGLVQYLRDRSYTADDVKKLDDYVLQLGSAKFNEREQAYKKLIALGHRGLEKLRKAQNDDDPEIAEKAKGCVKAIEQNPRGDATMAAVIRTLLGTASEETEAVLLDFLPCVNDELLEEDIWFGLDRLAKKRKQVVPALIAALNDVAPRKRALAACIVGRRGDSDQRGAVKKLLQDADATVRLRAAQGLLGANDKAGIPTLVELLNQPSIAVAWQAEELLHYVAGDGAPEVTVGSGSPKARAICRKTWATWWSANEAKVELQALTKTPQRPGLVLLFGDHFDDKEGQHFRAWTVGCNGRMRWHFLVSNEITSAHILPDNRVLLTQFPEERLLVKEKRYETIVTGVTERDLDGKILWQCKTAIEPYDCRRLPNGNTLILDVGGRQVIEEVTRNLKVVSSHRLESNANGLSPTFFFLGNGNLIYRWEDDRVAVRFGEVDPFTQEIVNDFSTDVPLARDAWLESLREGGYLVAARKEAAVLEVGYDGKTRKRWPLKYPPLQAFRLRTGNTLVLGERVIEIDDGGKVVWEAIGKTVKRGQPTLNLVRLGFDAPRPVGLDLDTSVAWRLKGVSDKDPLVQRASIQALMDLGAKDDAVIDALFAVLASPDESPQELTHYAALDALDALGALGRQIAPRALEALKDPRPRVRVNALRLVNRLNQAKEMTINSEKVVTLLIGAMQDDNNVVRESALQMLTDHGDDNRVLSVFIKTIKSYPLAGRPSEQEMVIIALYGISRLQPEAKTVLPLLIEMLKTRDITIRRVAVRVIGSLKAGGKPAVSALLEVFKAEDIKEHKMANALRQDCIATFSDIGREARDAIPVLKATLNDPDELTRAYAEDALKKVEGTK